MKNYILWIFIVFTSISFSQSKYFIFFKDKGVKPSAKLEKSSGVYNNALSLLSEKSIERRINNMGENDFITYEDLPLNKAYVLQIEELGIKIENKLRWFNAVTAYLLEAEKNKVSSFSFVKKIEPVMKFVFKSPELEAPSQLFKDESTENDSLDNPSQHNHGTLVFSIVGGFKEGSLIGSAFGSDFILAKTEDIRSEKHIEEDKYAAALEWMESYGVDITSSSLGYSTFDPPEFSYTYADMDGKTTIVTKALELTFRRGVVTVSSAGNEGGTSWFYITAPADGINTLAIGAVNNDNQIAAFSSRGPSYDGRIKPDVVTQGV